MNALVGRISNHSVVHFFEPSDLAQDLPKDLAERQFVDKTFTPDLDSFHYRMG